MASVRQRMLSVLGEWGEPEEMDSDEVSMKALAPQLILAMQAMGLDMSNDDHIDQFLKTLKTLATSKSSLLKMALKRWSPSKATKALKVAKATL